MSALRRACTFIVRSLVGVWQDQPEIPIAGCRAMLQDSRGAPPRTESRSERWKRNSRRYTLGLGRDSRVGAAVRLLEVVGLDGLAVRRVSLLFVDRSRHAERLLIGGR